MDSVSSTSPPLCRSAKTPVHACWHSQGTEPYSTLDRGRAISHHRCALLICAMPSPNPRRTLSHPPPLVDYPHRADERLYQDGHSKPNGGRFQRYRSFGTEGVADGVERANLGLQTAMFEAFGEAGRPTSTAVTCPDSLPLLSIENDPPYCIGCCAP